MNFLFVSIYYYPEIGSSDYYVDDMMHYLNERGHNVFVVAPNPVRDLCKGQIEKYSKIDFETKNNVGIYRLFCNKSSSNSVFNRVKRLIKFKRQLKKFLKINHDKFDAIFFPSNPPIFIPLMIEKLGKKYSFRTIYAINDLWPQITGKYNFLKPYAKKAILRADKLITLSNDMKNSIQLFSGRNDIEIIRIWPDDSLFFNNKYVENYDYSFLENKEFNIFYIGNIGAFQNIDFVINVAKEMLNDKNVKFYLVGSGRRKQHILERLKKEKITNAIYVPRVSNEVASSLYKLSSLNIISLCKEKIRYACPSKTSTCLFAGKPTLLLMDDCCYTKELVDNKLIFLDSSFNVKDVSKKIREIRNFNFSPEYKINSKTLEDYSKDKNLKLWVSTFEE